jgi:hypothetical protein
MVDSKFKIQDWSTNKLYDGISPEVIENNEGGHRNRHGTYKDSGERTALAQTSSTLPMERLDASRLLAPVFCLLHFKK